MQPLVGWGLHGILVWFSFSDRQLVFWLFTLVLLQCDVWCNVMWCNAKSETLFQVWPGTPCLWQVYVVLVDVKLSSQRHINQCNFVIKMTSWHLMTTIINIHKDLWLCDKKTLSWLLMMALCLKLIPKKKCVTITLDKEKLQIRIRIIYYQLIYIIYS